MGLLDKLKNTFKRTSESFMTAVAGKKVGPELFEEIEEALIKADVGIQTASVISEKLKSRRFPRDTTEHEIKEFLADEIIQIMQPYESNLLENISHNPEIILIIGVNGNGKTTTIAKLANIYKSRNLNPLMIAGDTFRAAAVEQLKYWGEQMDVPVFSGKENADAAGLIYSGIEQARTMKNQVVLVDTAGRMQNRDDLLAELLKIKRVIAKLDESAPHKTILVLDGMTGQSAHAQVDSFLNKIGIDGLVVTKLDSTAKGGVLISLAQKYKTPICAIGVGEGISDIQPFSAKEYAHAILGT